MEVRQDRSRAASGSGWLDDLRQDLAYGWRTLRRSPGFGAVATLSLALGIGANTAIFSVVYALMLKPLPYAEAGQLYNVFQAQPQQAVRSTGWSYPNFEMLREQNHVFSDLAGAQHHQLTLTGRGDPTVVTTSVVTAHFFALFEQQPLLGRVFDPHDSTNGAPAVAILSEPLWRQVFHADPGTIGSSIVLDQQSFTVVGVMPAAFRFPVLAESQQVWLPLAQDPLFGTWTERRQGHWLQVTGRLKPGVSAAQARAELDTISARLARDFPAENHGWTAAMLPLHHMFVRETKPALFVLLAAVAVVLAVACANVANLLLARATSRSKEIAVRAALGASRGRIVRQLLSEAAILGLVGGLTGVVFAYWGVAALNAFWPAAVPRLNVIQVDTPVLCFAVIVSLAATMTFGVAPALFSARADVQEGLRHGGSRSGESGPHLRAGRVLAAAEIALAMVLLVVAGLLLRSLSKLMAVDPGFGAQRIVKADVSLPRFQYATPAQWTAFADELLAGIHAHPGLSDAAVVVPIPIVQGFVNLGFEIVGVPSTSAGESRTADYVSASPEYFRVMGIPLLAGRLFSDRDRRSAPAVTIVSRTLAQRYFPNQDAVGKRLLFGFPPDPGTAREIVGVVGDVRDVSLGEAPGPMMYVPFAQAPFWGAGLVVKSRLSTSAVAAIIRRETQRVDPALPITDIAEMPDLLNASVAGQKFRTFLLALFAGMALVLSTTGIFGVIAYSVSRRTNEIGIRAALGASRRVIFRMIVGETFAVVGAGVAVGVPCSMAASRLTRGFLFGVSTGDPGTFTVVVVILAGVAMLAAMVPARRAMRVEAMVALRHE